MTRYFFQKANKIQTILSLRTFAILIQILLILFVNLALQYQLPWLPLIIVILLETLFTFVSYRYYQQRGDASQQALLAQILADILFLSTLLFYSGGATNAFVSLLLIPISLAAVILPLSKLAVVALSAVICYSVLLWQLPMSVMHGNMEGHFIGMWVNFLFSAVVVATFIGGMARSISQRELAIAEYRENLLKQEKVIALGVASAQVTHQLATPIASVQLLVEELDEQFPNNEIIEQVQQQVERCTKSLNDFREMTFNIREQVVKPLACQQLLSQISDHVALDYPDINMAILAHENNEIHAGLSVLADAALLPAVLNLISNAIRATKGNHSDKIELNVNVEANNWQLTIRDYGKGFSLSELANLGVKPVESQFGLGMAVLLSHASLERLGGKLALTNHASCGALVTLSLPIVETQQTKESDVINS